MVVVGLTLTLLCVLHRRRTAIVDGVCHVGVRSLSVSIPASHHSTGAVMSALVAFKGEGAEGWEGCRCE